MKFSSAVMLVMCLGLIGYAEPSFAEAEDEDPFDGRLLPVELVMQHRQAIGLTPQQNRAIGKLVVAVQKSVAEQQWELQSSYFELIELLDQPTIDEDRAVTVARQALDVENDIKIEQIGLLIQIRNLLNSEQIEMLRQRLKDS